ncbi:hypothetical protein STCU_00003 [Strigomonas culicis]|uniref:Uncharacterized protein n=1 Tax=Strigomonas culicis TaxID=28005 RepID=S9V8A7_9TRYP|nr:hypothetical protein STCU_00003 [Strigomonas culicis]|eukprot:EPY37294.1 hypothetical protein STCU_00003 [Strigomonas culicis]
MNYNLSHDADARRRMPFRLLYTAAVRSFLPLQAYRSTLRIKEREKERSMLFRRTRLLRSAYEELLVVGSRWTRITAKPVATEGPPHVQASLAQPCITVIPTLHVASIAFYDKVLEYMDNAVRRRHSDCVILLEGICDSGAAEADQLEEYQKIMADASLRETMLQRAQDNTVHSREVIRDICLELALDYDTVMAQEDTIRLQECYLKPKMAAICGLNLRNNCDADMKEVQQLLKEEVSRITAAGDTMPTSVSVSDLGRFPIIRKFRERKVAEAARRQCEQWLEQEIEGEVIVPWGYFHTEAIIHYIFEGGKAVAAATPQGAKKPAAVFAEDDELVAKVSFGVPRELFVVKQEKPAAEPASPPPAEKETKRNSDDDLSTLS